MGRRHLCPLEATVYRSDDQGGGGTLHAIRTPSALNVASVPHFAPRITTASWPQRVLRAAFACIHALFPNHIDAWSKGLDLLK